MAETPQRLSERLARFLGLRQRQDQSAPNGTIRGGNDPDLLLAQRRQQAQEAQRQAEQRARQAQEEAQRRAQGRDGF